MNELQIFSNQEFGEIRTVKIGDKPYFVGIDVARALEYAKPSQAVIDHCKGIHKMRIPSYNQHGAQVIQETNVIPEGDIYRLIVKAAMQSKNPEIKEKASKFEAWLFDDVVPCIRKTGSYSTKAYQTKSTSVGEITNLIKTLKAIMKEEKHLPEDIANMAQMICNQFNVFLPQNFVKKSPYEQLSLTVTFDKPLISVVNS
jgi:prophage antirepressor-like protein